jgi:parallel beta-helix repeat protein
MYSNHTRILNNLIQDNGAGGIAVGYNYDTYVYDNTLYYNQMGIVTGLTKDLVIEQNDIYDNLMLGIGLQETNDTITRENLISNNGLYGIWITAPMTKCINNSIISNEIYDHDEFGVGFNTNSSQNIIYQNTFIGNLVNAEDNGTLNSWDNGSIGNYWDDYSGADTDDNGIGDTPYLISGSSGSMDNFPIYDDGPDDQITITIHQPVVLATYGTIAPEFNITLIGTDVDTTWYSFDSGVTNIIFTGLTGTLDQTEWNKLHDGVITIRFYANNSAGQVFFKDVTIIKDTSIITPGIPSMSVFLIVPITIMVVIILTFQFKKKIK